MNDLFNQSIADILQMINFKYFGQKHRNTQSSWCYKFNSETPSGQNEKQNSLCILSTEPTQHREKEPRGRGQYSAKGHSRILILIVYVLL